MPRPALETWHKGELAVQKIMNLPQRVSISAVFDSLPDQHRVFHCSKLFFLGVTTLDSRGRPWASILTSKSGTPGFIESPDESSLVISARTWDGDPTMMNLDMTSKIDDKLLFAAVGLETSTRRRNKFAGSITEVVTDGYDITLRVHVSHALGLCPKYINVRNLSPYTCGRSKVLHQNWNMDGDASLPPAVVDFIHSADTAYLATYYRPVSEDKTLNPARAGTNHRGGQPGFVRVRPSDRRTLVLPNYAGNRLMNSLGNIFVTPLAGIVFPAFSKGSILYVTGESSSLFGMDAHKLMPGMKSLTLICATGYSLVENALPFRQTSEPTRSPYSPPVRYLAEETTPAVTFEEMSASLLRVRVHNASLVTLTFRATQPLFGEIRPSGNVVLDVSEFIRARSHELMDWQEDGRVNDDCVRTWTVSNPPTVTDPDVFSITMRSVPGGLVTPVIYRLAHEIAKGSTDNVDVSHLGVRIRLRGIGGDLPVPEAVAQCDGGRKLIWVAGGIGITPFLGLTRHVAQLVRQTFGLWDVALVISTREPDVIVTLISEALEVLHDNLDPQDLQYVVHIFSPTLLTVRAALPTFVVLQTHLGRIGDDGNIFETLGAKIANRSFAARFHS